MHLRVAGSNDNDMFWFTRLPLELILDPLKVELKSVSPIRSSEPTLSFTRIVVLPAVCPSEVSVAWHRKPAVREALHCTYVASVFLLVCVHELLLLTPKNCE